MRSNRLKEMCIDISVSIIEKLFNYEETWVPVMKYNDQIWFKAVAVATILRYKNTMKSIRDHDDPEDNRKLSKLGPKTKQNETDPLKSKQNESFWLKTASESRGSKTDPLKRNAFKRWVTKDVLPSIRKTGRYSYDDMNHKYNDI